MLIAIFKTLTIICICLYYEITIDPVLLIVAMSVFTIEGKRDAKIEERVNVMFDVNAMFKLLDEYDKTRECKTCGGRERFEYVEPTGETTEF